MTADASQSLRQSRLRRRRAPPLGLLHEPHRVRVTRVSNAHHEEMGGASCRSFPNHGFTPNPRSEADACRRRSATHASASSDRGFNNNINEDARCPLSLHALGLHLAMPDQHDVILRNRFCTFVYLLINPWLLVISPNWNRYLMAGIPCLPTLLRHKR